MYTSTQACLLPRHTVLAYVYVYTYIHMPTYIHMYWDALIYTYVLMYINLYIWTHIYHHTSALNDEAFYASICVRIHIHTYTYIYTYVLMYINLYACTHTYQHTRTLNDKAFSSTPPGYRAHREWERNLFSSNVYLSHLRGQVRGRGVGGFEKKWDRIIDLDSRK